MSRISKQIRAYVDDPDSTGQSHYGEWGILRRDQRRLIRRLCDECDAFERDADHIAEQYEALLREKDAEIERLTKANQHFAELENGYIVTGYKNIRAEAITEFAERAKRRLPIVSPSVFDKISKEMKEDLL